MGYASQAGRARTSSTNPRAHAICDRCGFRYNWINLHWQFDYRGTGLANIRILCCDRCLDVPQNQLRSIALPADPLPIINARPEPYVDDEGGNSPVYGQPVGLTQAAVMPYNGATQHAYGVPLSLLSVTSGGGTTITVTCSAAHGLSTNDQISADGLSNTLACGFFSVTVTSATALTYTTATAVTAGSLLTPTTRIVTALVGLPYSTTTIPQGV